MISSFRNSRTSYSVDKPINSIYQSPISTSQMGLENHVAQLSAENERLSVDLKSRTDQIESMRSRFETLERNSNAALQEYADRLEHQKRMEVDEVINKSKTYLNTEIASLENQNKLLQTRNVENERKIYSLNDEVQRLTQIVREKTNEVEQWKLKYTHLESDAKLHSENLRSSIGAKSRDDLSSITREFNSKLQDERRNYEMQMKTVKQVLGDLESKLKLASSDAERFNLALAEKDNEIINLRNKFAQYEKTATEEINNLINKFEREKREFIDREITSQSLKFADERLRHEDQMKEISQHIIDVENKMKYLSIEIERLHALLQEKTRESDMLRQEYKRMEDAKNSEILNLQQNFENLRRSALKEVDIDTKYQAEKSALAAEILQYRQKVQELEANVQDLMQENEKLNGTYSFHEKEIENLRAQNRNKVNLGELEALKRENESLRLIVSEADELRSRFEVERQKKENQITQLAQYAQVNKLEIEKLYGLVDIRRQENENLNRQLNETRNEIEKFEFQNKELEGRCVVLNNKYEQMLKEAQNMQKSRDSFKSQLEKGNIEIAQKNRELLEKIKEVDTLKMKYEETISNLRLDVKRDRF